MNVLVVDVGGSHVKILATRQDEPRRFSSGPKMTAERMVSDVKELVGEWKYDVVSIGYPGPALRDRVVLEPHNLAPGWVGFDFQSAFGRPVKLINDAAMQALGSYKGGKLLFLGLGTGLGSTLVGDGIVEPMELGHLPYKKGTYEDYVGAGGLERRGKKKWRKHVADVVAHLIAALQPNDVVLGGGNVNELKELPPGCRAGDNANAFLGGFRMWEDSSGQRKGGRSHETAVSRHQPGSERNPTVKQSVLKKETIMQLGMIGLGRMGANMVRRLLQGDHQCVVFDRSSKAVKELTQEKAVGASSLADLFVKESVFVQRSAYHCYKLVLRAVLLGSVCSVLTSAVMAQESGGKAGEPQKLPAPGKEDLSPVSAKVDVNLVARDEEIRKPLQSVLNATDWFTDPQVRVEEGVVFLWLNGREHSWLKVRSSVIRLVKRAFQKHGISMPDEAREVVFPQGVPVTVLDGKPRETHGAMPRKRLSAESLYEELDAVSTKAEAGLYSEAGVIEEQARQVRPLKDGENLLQVAIGTPASEEQAQERKQ